MNIGIVSLALEKQKKKRENAIFAGILSLSLRGWAEQNEHLKEELAS